MGKLWGSLSRAWRRFTAPPTICTECGDPIAAGEAVCSAKCQDAADHLYWAIR